MTTKIKEIIKVALATLALVGLGVLFFNAYKKHTQAVYTEKITTEKLLKSKLESTQIELEYWKQKADSFQLEDEKKDHFIIKKQLEVDNKDSITQVLKSKVKQLINHRYEQQTRIISYIDTSQFIRSFTNLQFTPRQGTDSKR